MFKGFVLNRCYKGQVRSNGGNSHIHTGLPTPQRLIEPPDVSVLKRAGGAAGPDGLEGTSGRFLSAELAGKGQAMVDAAPVAESVLELPRLRGFTEPRHDPMMSSSCTRNQTLSHFNATPAESFYLLELFCRSSDDKNRRDLRPSVCLFLSSSASSLHSFVL